MEIIAALEGGRRGVYAGAVGYLDFAGNLDFCITIRTVLLEGGKAFVQAGAGSSTTRTRPLSARKRSTRPAPSSRPSSWPTAG